MLPINTTAISPLNATDGTQQCDNSKESIIVKTTAFAIVLFMALIGNTLVLILVKRSTRMNGAINLFVANMAISDLFVPLFVIPREMYQLLNGTIAWQISGTLGTVMCKIVFFASDISPIVSVLMLCLIAIDRFTAIVFPRVAALGSRRVHLFLITISWLIAICFCAPYFYIFKLTQRGNDSYCFPDWSPAFDHVQTHRGYTTAVCVLFVIVPLTLLVVLYTVIVYKLKRQKAVRFLEGAARARRNLRALQVMKLAVTIVVAFGICWGPFNTALLIVTFIWKWDPPATCAFRTFWFIALFMAYSNAAVNPWIYFAFVENYKRGLHDACRCFSDISSNNLSAKCVYRLRRVSPSNVWRSKTSDGSKLSRTLTFDSGPAAQVELTQMS